MPLQSYCIDPIVESGFGNYWRDINVALLDSNYEGCYRTDLKHIHCVMANRHTNEQPNLAHQHEITVSEIK